MGTTSECCCDLDKRHSVCADFCSIGTTDTVDLGDFIASTAQGASTNGDCVVQDEDRFRLVTPSSTVHEDHQDDESMQTAGDVDTPSELASVGEKEQHEDSDGESEHTCASLLLPFFAVMTVTLSGCWLTWLTRTMVLTEGR